MVSNTTCCWPSLKHRLINHSYVQLEPLLSPSDFICINHIRQHVPSPFTSIYHSFSLCRPFICSVLWPLSAMTTSSPPWRRYVRYEAPGCLCSINQMFCWTLDFSQSRGSTEKTENSASEECMIPSSVIVYVYHAYRLEIYFCFCLAEPDYSNKIKKIINN